MSDLVVCSPKSTIRSRGFFVSSILHAMVRRAGTPSGVLYFGAVDQPCTSCHLSLVANGGE
ncbi:hypothetical protein [Acinetobacter baumannii]|uniref:hypothetical protein n=1 Tax=Acinetobacter baumannii TaxID=470 RepID=UPI0024C434B7|nr:hypothetical protein [Acinetobacter baumannii]MDK1596080.1 hypothetical protein [Acinetobacter baumannii]